ncbi:helix-turn-helix domain-containing protein [Georgenia sp. EYE_87]|uniref:IclR family transcriptional regulator domain-containing protein n=1 Tax=Georgenia sp. EYE_87 TaxID=2853448 RepID=UPI00200447FE|nr:IclR family transcriptional regulator C-terminal domain-containing protein [Georgenia sp. EYE_87]MCK6209037.1 helix-turn-helix domain-containing protein [Georgenia sp. EYE_87]
MSDEGEPEGLQSLARGLGVLRVLAAADGPLTLAEVAHAAALNRAVARRVLLTLVDVGYVLARGREFSLRPRVLELGEAYRASLRLPALALPAMRRLSAATGQSISLGVLDGAEVVYVQRVVGARIVDVVLDVGTRVPAHATAIGRVLLADLGPDERAAVLGAGPLGALTPTTVTDPARLGEVLDRVRAQGYAHIDEEFEPGLTTLAAPVVDDGVVVAAVNLPLSTASLPPGGVGPDLVGAVVAAGREISAAVAEAAGRAGAPPGRG